MAELDARLLDTARMSSAKAATILNRSRQTVARGVRQTDRTYFRDDDIELLYGAVARERPSVAPAVKMLIEREHPELARRMDEAHPSQRFAKRAKTARRLWLVLPQLGNAMEMWGEISRLLERDDLHIDVFVDDDASHRIFRANSQLLFRGLREAGRMTHAEITLWQPMQIIGMLQRTVVVDPHSARTVAAFNWRGGVFEPIDEDETARLVSCFVARALSPPRPNAELEITTLGTADSTPPSKRVDIDTAIAQLSVAA